jgi:hypothetical protein
MTATRKLTLGDSTIGYDTASVTTTGAGKLRLVPGSIVGRVSHIKRAIAAYNRTGQLCYTTTTTTGDEKSLHLSRAA